MHSNSTILNYKREFVIGLTILFMLDMRAISVRVSNCVRKKVPVGKFMATRRNLAKNTLERSIKYLSARKCLVRRKIKKMIFSVMKK